MKPGASANFTTLQLRPISWCSIRGRRQGVDIYPPTLGFFEEFIRKVVFFAVRLARNVYAMGGV